MHLVQPPAARDEEAVLQFEDCSLPFAGGAEEVFSLDLVVRPGDLVMLQVEDTLLEQAVVEAVCGLLPPLAGKVRFLGRDWRELTPDWANASRGRVGVVFREEGWVPYLSIMDNVVLAQLHHTRRSYEDVCGEAARWAARFGLPGLPGDLPAAVSAADRATANFVRAFVGAPSLIVVEHLAARPSAAFLQKLVNAMRDVREHGAAVLWLTQDLALARNEFIPATQHLVLGGSRRRTEESAA